MSLLSSPTILWGSLTWTAFTEDILMCPYTNYVSCSSFFITWALMFQSSPICLNALWNLGFFSSFLGGLTFLLSLNELIQLSLVFFRHSSRGEWHSSLLRETHPCQISLCWQSFCASPILCPGIQSTWLNGYYRCSRITNMSASGGSDHIVFEF